MPLRIGSRGWLTLLLLAGGCVAPRDRFPVGAPQPPDSGQYRLLFPDAVEVHVQGRSDCSGIFPLNAEGRIDLPPLGSPRVEGLTAGELREWLRGELDLPPERVDCRVAQFRGQSIYVYGLVSGPPRSMPYQGPEDVVAFLRRAGGLDPGAAVRRIHVVRSNLQRDQPPQVFEVDLHAILKKDDPRSNVTLLPLDEVYVGQTSRSMLYKLLPEWLKLDRRKRP